MNTLTEDFDIFVKKITLNKTKVDDIIAKHNELTDMIKNDVPDGYEIIKTRLSGSYAKNTAMNTKFDFDMVCPFKRNAFGSNGTLKQMYEDVFDFLNLCLADHRKFRHFQLK